MSSIIVIIAYLLALSLSIYHQIYTIAIKLSMFLYDRDFRCMKNNLSFGFYLTCTLVFRLQNLDEFVKFHSLLSVTVSLQHSTVQELICKNEFLLLLSHEIALIRVC